MEMTVESLIDALAKMPAKARVEVRTYNEKDEHVKKSVHRIDNFGDHVQIIVQRQG